MIIFFRFYYVTLIPHDQIHINVRIYVKRDSTFSGIFEKLIKKNNFVLFSF